MNKHFLSILYILLFSCNTASYNAEQSGPKIQMNSSLRDSYTDSSIVDYLDNIIIREPYYLPIEFNDAYIVLCKGRLHIFRSNENWAIVFERIGYNTRTKSLSCDIISYGNNLQNIDYISDKPTNIKTYTIYRFNDSVQEFTEWTLQRGIPKFNINSICPDSQGTKQHNICICHYLVDNFYNQIKINDSLISSMIAKNTHLFCNIDAWYQKPYSAYENDATGTPPSKSIFYKSLAKAICSGDTNAIDFSEGFNTHWKNWPLSGAY